MPRPAPPFRAAESLARRIAEAHERGVACMAIVGRNEVAARSVTLRVRNQPHVLPFEEALAELCRRCAPPALRS